MKWKVVFLLLISLAVIVKCQNDPNDDGIISDDSEMSGEFGVDTVDTPEIPEIVNDEELDAIDNGDVVEEIDEGVDEINSETDNVEDVNQPPVAISGASASEGAVGPGARKGNYMYSEDVLDDTMINNNEYNYDWGEFYKKKFFLIPATCLRRKIKCCKIFMKFIKLEI